MVSAAVQKPQTRRQSPQMPQTPPTTQMPQQTLQQAPQTAPHTPQTARLRPSEPPSFMWTTLCQYQPEAPKKKWSSRAAASHRAAPEGAKACKPTPASLESLGQLLGQLDVGVPRAPRRPLRKAPTDIKQPPPPLGHPNDGRLRSASDKPNLLAKPAPGEYMLLSRRGGIRCVVVVWD